MGLPEGYTRSNPERASAFWDLEAGNILEGMYLGRFSRAGKKGKIEHYYQVRVMRPVKCTVYEDKEKQSGVEVSEGTIVQADERFAMRGWADLDTSKVWSVYVEPVDKVDIGGGQKMWNMEVGHRELLEEIPF